MRLYYTLTLHEPPDGRPACRDWNAIPPYTHTMNDMSLSQALKLKNRIVAEVNRAKEILLRENSRANSSTSKVDRAAVYKTLQDKTAHLVHLKSAITQANIGIYPVLCEMEELKGRIAFLKSLNTFDGNQRQPRMHGDDHVEVFTAFFTAEKVDEEVGTVQARIDALQDQADAFNATTRLPLA